MDILLNELIKRERWEAAIEDGVNKDMPKDVLRQLCMSNIRIAIYQAIDNGSYQIAPPHIAKIKKDAPGEYRTVYINENIDRVVLSIVNNILFDLCADMIHPNCKSYQKGIGCPQIVSDIPKMIEQSSYNTVGFKADLSKYFDSVPIEIIDRQFDKVEQKLGKSKVIDVLRAYYHQDMYLDLEYNLCHTFQSLKQGCAVAAWLADSILFDLDVKMSSIPGFYVRYSDDILYLGKSYSRARRELENELGKVGLTLNPKKFQLIKRNQWFKFLGFNICGKQVTLSASRLENFTKEILKLTVLDPSITMTKALNRVNKYLYKGDYAWAKVVLPYITVEEDIDTLNAWVMDCIRYSAVPYKKRKNPAKALGGIGCNFERKNGIFERQPGSYMETLLRKSPKEIIGYNTMRCMRDDLLIARPLFETIVRQM